jgi:hypothetical protein
MGIRKGAEDMTVDTSEAAKIMGSVRSERKTEAARERYKARVEKYGPMQGGRKPQPLSAIECTCKAGNSLEGHKSYCPRGKAIKRRQDKGLPLEF